MMTTCLLHLRKRIRGCLIGLMAVMIAYAPLVAVVGKEPRNVLTWRETVGAVFFQHEDSGAYLKRANPQAKDALWKIIGNDSYRKYHSPAISMLSYIGDDQDVKRLGELTKSALQDYVDTPRFARGVFAIPEAVGLMARRSVPGARELIRKMPSHQYWRDVGTSAQIPAGLLTDDIVDTLVRMSFRGLALSGEDDLEKFAHEITKDITDPDRKRSLEFLCNPASQREGAEKSLAALDKPVSTNGLAEKVIGTPDNFRPSTIHDFVEDSMYLKKRTGGRRKKGYVTGVNVTDKLPAEERDALAKEALEAYRQISREMLDKNRTFRDWAGKLLMVGRPLNVSEWEKHPVFFQDLKNVATVTREVVQLDPKPAEFEFWRDQVDYQKYFFRYVPGKEIEVTTVMFRLEGTESIEFTVRQDSPTRREDGYFVVLMKKVDGKWYWNPFGW